MVEAETATRIKQQGQRLKKLREQRQLSKSLLSSRLGFATTQAYDLYERGASIIRLDRLGVWAEAFEIPYEDFVAIVRGEIDPADGWTFRDALRGDGRIPEWLINDLAQDWEGKPILNQRAAARGILQLAEKRLGDFGPKSSEKNSRETHAL